MADDPDDDRLTDAEVDAFLRAHGDPEDAAARKARIKARFDAQIAARRRGVVYRYVEPGADGVTPVVIVCTRAQVLAAYYPYWCERMRKAGKAHLISEEACLDDFVVVHWAEVIAGED